MEYWTYCRIAVDGPTLCPPAAQLLLKVGSVSAGSRKLPLFLTDQSSLSRVTRSDLTSAAAILALGTVLEISQAILLFGRRIPVDALES